MIGSVVTVSGYFATGGGAFGASAGAAASGNAGRVLDGAGATLQALNDGRGGVDQIKSMLTKLRDALQAAREQADAVPGRTVLRPVVADVEQTRDKTTYVTVDGAPVPTGTITTWLGTRPLVVGYETANRAPLDVGEALRSLASTVATLVSRVGADGAGGFAADVSALLQNKDFITAANTPDAAAIDSAIARINATLAKAHGLGLSIGARTSAAARIDLGGLLLGAIPNADAGAAGPAGGSAASLYESNASA